MKNGFEHLSAPNRRLTSMFSTLAIWLSLAGFPATLAAQETQGTTQEVEVPTPLEWQGITASKGESGNEVVSLWDFDDAALEQHLAEIELELNTTRDFEAGLARLNPLWIRAARHPSNPDLMIKIAAQRGKALFELGKLQEARKAVTIIWPDEIELTRWIQPAEVTRFKLDKVRLDLAPLQPVLKLIDTRFPVGREPWLTQVVPDRVKLDWAEKNFGLPGQSLFRLVIENINTPGIAELGLRAVPSLVIATLGSLTDTDLEFGDPLRDLAAIDSAAAARTCLRWIKAGDEGFRFRTLEIFRSRYPIDLQDASEWHFPSDERMPTQLKVPEWMSVLEHLAEDERMEAAVFEILRPAISFGGLSPALIERLAKKMATASRSEARNLLGLLEAPHRVPSLIPVYESGLESSLPFVKRECLRLLCEFPLGKAALSVVDAPDPALRQTLASAIGPRTARVGPWVTTPPPAAGHFVSPAERQNIQVTNRRTPALIEAWVNLIQDPDPAVRDELLFHSNSVPAEVCEAGLASPDPKVRGHYARLLRSDQGLSDEERERLVGKVLSDRDPAVRSEAAGYANSAKEQRAVFVALLSDVDPTVQSELDSVLYNMWSKHKSAVHFELLLDGRLGHALPLDLESPEWRDWYGDQLMERPDLVGRALPILVRHEQETAISVLLRWIPMKSGGPEIIHGLRPEDQASLFAFAYRMGFIVNVRGDSASGLQALTAVALDSTLDPAVRIAACERGQINLIENETAEAAALDLIRLADAKHTLSLERTNFRGPRANLFLARAAQDTTLADAKVLHIADACFHESQPGADQAAEALLGRIIPNSYSRPVVKRALSHLMRPATWKTYSQYLLLALEDESLAEVAVHEMNRIGDDSFLAPLGACLLNRGNRVETRATAASALKRYGPPAREYLIQALLTTEGAAHRTVVEALEAIDDWEARRSGTPRLGTREEAIAELLRFMKEGKSVSVRAEAIRGIATFGAIEAIPLLIPLLEDEDDAIRKAAQEALQTLHDSARRDGSSGN